MTDGEILKKYIEDNNIVVSRLAAALGMSRQNFYQLYKSIEFEKDTIDKLESGLKSSFKDIRKTVNVPRETDNIVNDDDEETYIDKRRKQKNTDAPFMVPLVPVKAQAGYVKNFDNIDFLNELETYAIVPGIDPRGTTWRYFEVEGDSMRDTLNNHDYVLCNFVPNFDWHEIKDNYIYVVVNHSTPHIKRIKKKNANEWILKSDNREYPSKTIKVSDIKEVWKARRTIGGDLGPVKKTKHYDLEP